MFGQLRSFKCWIQTEACVIPSYHGMLIRDKTDKQIVLKEDSALDAVKDATRCADGASS